METKSAVQPRSLDAGRHFETGMDLFARGLAQEATDQLARAYALESSDRTYQSSYGLAPATVAGNYSAGIEPVSAAIAESQSPVHHVNLARAHLRHRQQDNAVSQLYDTPP